MQLKNEQIQKQTLRPQMIQSMQILQLNTVQLEEYLQNLSMENPLMEFVSRTESFAPKQPSPTYPDQQNRAYDKLEQERRNDLWSSISAPDESLADALMLQITTLHLDPMDQKILKHMIHCLEPNGYLVTSLDHIRSCFNCEEETISRLLQILQSLEPMGVGARNLSECLLIQLSSRFPQEETARIIAQDHLELLGKNQLKQLAKVLHKSVEEINHACNLIRSLEPRPGAAYHDGQKMQYIHPELLVLQEENTLTITLNEHQVPAINISGYYLDLMQEEHNPEVSTYLNQKKQQLDWVQQCISQRNETLLSLGKLILEVQQDFFLKGPGCLKAFTQADAAKQLGVHESTVSRAARDKHLQCMWGIYPLSHFFQQGLSQKDEIRSRIHSLIDREDKYSPLSDQAISDALALEGHSISKRLVTKYRNEMQIPNTSGRKKF